MSKRRNKNTLPDPKDKRIAELEQELAEALAILQKVQRQLELLKYHLKNQGQARDALA